MSLCFLIMSPAQVTPPRRKKTRSRRKKSNRRQLPPHTGLTLEIGAKIVVNAVLATAAIAAINKLVPNYQTQRLRLEEVQQEVQQTQARVDELNQEFTRNFDPNQSEIIMQQQTNQIKPNQRHLVWLKPKQ
ncbi:hypothetical protein PCC7418_3686 [Halothece sp. PCC 7418]|uniref:slr1601 family putative cell division protein n=1 Tax=Halothece sp. (strain PCC 7418) TaxID=65093 RepID=UPI0002A07FEC|nr:hypothetical protein [Halothece sp. PCC 7418]AFZ45792.1 hypothetical protein PCC7418_3686 [Halothece sp. PCC 7418]